MKRKIGHVTFEYNDDFRGEVLITRGESSVSITVESLRLFIAEAVRYDLAAHIQKMKPSDLLRRIA